MLDKYHDGDQVKKGEMEGH